MQTPLRFVLCFLAAVSFWPNAFGQPLPPFYERRAVHDPNGTGVFFMGREIAHVCQGGEWLERPEREKEENSELMVDLLQLQPGESVADVGAGTGYISRKLAKRVGPTGAVYATEIQQEMLDALTNKAIQAGITNIKPVLGIVSDPKLPEASIDTIIMVDVYHEFDRPYEMVQALGKSLKPGGRIVFVEFRAEDPKVPIRAVHKMTEAQVKKEMTVHPFVWVETIDKLPWQHMIVFRKGQPPQTEPKRAGKQEIASLEEMLEAKTDLWGETAIHQPNGPSYEFFKDLLPPLRYVNTAFRHYPIVLSAPGATNKARMVSNGSAVNARAELPPIWRENGFPVTFRVGASNEVFGADLRRLTGPALEKGYLPVINTLYESDGQFFEQEAFASVDRAFSQHALVFVQFRLRNGEPGAVSAHVDSTNVLTFAENVLRDSRGQAWVFTDGNWLWDAATRMLSATLAKKGTAALAIATRPMAQPAQVFTNPKSYLEQREQCVSRWQNQLDLGAQIDVPEPYVNNAWRALIAGIYTQLKGSAPNYSAGNQYERLYEAESGDVARAALLFGQVQDAQRMVVPCLDYTRPGLYSHQAAFKLQLLAHYYWISRDRDFFLTMKPRWNREVKRLVDGREENGGLLPKEQYAGDIHEDVSSLNSNANGAKALRDLAAVLRDIGETNDAGRIGDSGNELRRATLAAVEQSIVTNVQPPFIPIALLGAEKPYDRITDTHRGSYWNLMAPYVLGSDIFGLNSKRETEMLEYPYQHGGIAMGMIRFHQRSGLFANEDGVDDLYGLRHTDKLLQRDDVDRALVSFYGKLAHGLTRDTFIGAEGTSLRALDEFGRPMYLPPNSTANAFLLWTLRGLLVQDIDSDDDCSPDTLRLFFATPKRWLEDGKTIRLERMPSAFGEVVVTMSSQLKKGAVVADLILPARNRPKQSLLRARVPDGWKVVSASVEGKALAADEKGTVDLSAFKDRVKVQFKVERQR